jgi:hypothetical protein
MSLPDFLRFTPVAVRAQHNCWFPALQLRFVVALARGAGPDEAARALGRTRQSVYRLRRRPDAAGFAAAWDAAIAFSQEAAAAGRSPAPKLGSVEAILVPRFYRGRLIGFVQREDVAGAMRTLRRLDRLADKLAAENGRHAPAEATEASEASEASEAHVAALDARSDRGDGIRV